MFGDPPDIVGEGSVSDLRDVEGWWDNPGIAAWSFALLGCFLLNATLLLAFLVRPSLRTISNRFVMNLTASNLLVCGIINTLLIMDASSSTTAARTEESTSVGSSCGSSEAAITVVTTSSVLSVLLIGVDQYFAVVDPLRYRARVDKLKSGILIMSTWLISIVFGILAFLNPNPRGFWLSCAPRNDRAIDPLTVSTVAGIEIETSEWNVTKMFVPSTTVESISTNDDPTENATAIFDTLLVDSTISYGFVYAVLYSILAYFLPFAAVCWIYVSIYAAAHRNSERARRSGSRPILSSGSFTEEQNGPHRLQRLHADTVEDFRKLQKISSLSSIDETSETVQTTGQVSRRRSFSSSISIEVSSPPVDDHATGIVFTVGSKRMEVSDPQENRNDLDGKKSSEDWADHQRGSSDSDTDSNSDSESENEDEGEARFDALEEFSSKVSAGLEQPNEAKTDEDCTDRASKYGVDFKSRDTESGVMFKAPLEDESRPRFPIRGVSSELENRNGNKIEREESVIGRQNTTERSSACLLTPIVTITPAPARNDDGLHRVSSIRSTSSYISSLKDRISNGSIFRHREEARAAKISALVIVMGLICWSPYVIILVMKNLPRSIDQHLSHKYDAFTSSFLILAAYISPLLFGYRSKRVKRELRRFFCFRRELSYKNNRSLMAKKVLKRRHSSTLSHLEMDHKYNIFNCVYGKNRWPKEKVQFVQVPDTALTVETCRSSFSSGASTQISSTSTEEC
ncbi:uncharacterized protein LOC143343820 [Colletes latitarsis]|uniref:uncharacterized protein LOC143343820 n=1 Tax=Colletes latitarsis TaxID=2605962 RepID=UPI0040363584